MFKTVKITEHDRQSVTIIETPEDFARVTARLIERERAFTVEPYVDDLLYDPAMIDPAPNYCEGCERDDVALNAKGYCETCVRVARASGHAESVE